MTFALKVSAIKDYIEKDLSKFEKALYSYDYDTLAYGFNNYVDIEEFADYFIIAEVFLQHDTGNLSTYFYKDVNGKIKPCVWDFNNDLGNISTDNEDDFHIRQFVSVQLMTGLYNDKNYVCFGYMNDDEPTFSQLAQQAGYTTGMFGKWQLGRSREMPTRLGWDEWCLFQL